MRRQGAGAGLRLARQTIGTRRIPGRLHRRDSRGRRPMRQANELPAASTPKDRTRSLRRVAITHTVLLSLSLFRLAASASDVPPAPAVEPPARPAILFNRWQEDWSVLANPDVPKEPFDNLKY